MDRLARRLLGGLAESLDLPRAFFDGQFEPSMSSLRLLHYPPHPTADPAREVGCGAHTDWGLITILTQDTIGGLEIQLPSGEWIAAAPIPGSFIVNIGDMMARWTNDRYTSTPHRVLNRSVHDRYSVAFFCDPAYHTKRRLPAELCHARSPAALCADHQRRASRRDVPQDLRHGGLIPVPGFPTRRKAAHWASRGGRKPWIVSLPAELGAEIRNDPPALRRLIRSGGYEGRTGGLAMGFVQANLCILPAADADDFLRYCQRNPKPCPLLGRHRAGRSAPAGTGRRSRSPHRPARATMSGAMACSPKP